MESALLQIVNADSSDWTGIKEGIAYVAGTSGAGDGKRTLRGVVLRAFCLATQDFGADRRISLAQLRGWLLRSDLSPREGAGEVLRSRASVVWVQVPRGAP